VLLHNSSKKSKGKRQKALPILTFAGFSFAFLVYTFAFVFLPYL